MAKKAVVVGCNYPGTEAALSGCLQDAINWYNSLLHRFGFEEVILMVDDPDTVTGAECHYPSGAGIRTALENMVRDAQPGDTFFFFFSGHGGRQDVDAGEIDDTGYDEYIHPSDHDILDDDYFRTLLAPLPRGVTFTLVSDSCHSGGLIDQAKEQIGNSFEQLPMEEVVPDAAVSVEAELTDGEKALKKKELPAAMAAKILRERYGRDDIEAGNLRAKVHEIFGRIISSTPSGKKGSKTAKAAAAAKEKKKEKKKKKKKVEKEKKKKKGSMEAAEKGSSSSSESSDSDIDVDDEGDYGDDGGGGNTESNGVGVLVSGCQSHQFSADCEDGGALSKAIRTVLMMLEPDEPISNRQLVTRVRRHLASQGHKQEPGLYCADEKLDAPFISVPVVP